MQSMRSAADTSQCSATRGRASLLPTALLMVISKKKRWTCVLEGTPSLLSISIHGKSCPDGRLSSCVSVRCRVSPGGAMDSSQQNMSKTIKTHIFCKRTHCKDREAQRTASDRVLPGKVEQGTRHKKKSNSSTTDLVHVRSCRKTAAPLSLDIDQPLPPPAAALPLSSSASTPTAPQGGAPPTRATNMGGSTLATHAPPTNPLRGHTRIERRRSDRHPRLCTAGRVLPRGHCP